MGLIQVGSDCGNQILVGQTALLYKQNFALAVKYHSHRPGSLPAKQCVNIRACRFAVNLGFKENVLCRGR